MRLRAQVGIFTDKANLNEGSSSFQGAFKDRELFEMQTAKISEAVSRLNEESGQDPHVQHLVSNWSAVISKIKDASCGEIKEDLNKLMGDVTALYQEKMHTTVASAANQVQTQSAAVQLEIADDAQQQWHEVAMADQFEKVLEEHPQSLRTYIAALQAVQRGEYGAGVREALENLDSSFFNMQTLLAITLIEGIETAESQTIIDETFSTYAEENSNDCQTLIADLKNAGRPFLDKMLRDTASLSETEQTLHARLNALLSTSDMTYTAAQAINWFVGTKLQNLDEVLKEIDSYVSYDITEPETFAAALDNLTNLEGSQRKESFKELAANLYDMGQHELVEKVFDKMNELGLGNTVYVFMLGILPDPTTPRQVLPMILQFDQLAPLIDKIENPVDRNGYTINLLFYLAQSPPDPALHAQIDSKVAQIMQRLAAADTKWQAAALLVNYYCHVRADSDRAYAICNDPEFSPAMQQSIAIEAAKTWYIRGMEKAAPWSQGWRDFVERFLDSPSARAEAKAKILAIYEGMVPESTYKERNPDWDAINEH